MLIGVEGQILDADKGRVWQDRYWMLMGMADHLHLKLSRGINFIKFKLECTVMFSFTYQVETIVHLSMASSVLLGI